jgi:hypothetical protein
LRTTRSTLEREKIIVRRGGTMGEGREGGSASPEDDGRKGCTGGSISPEDDVLLVKNANIRRLTPQCRQRVEDNAFHQRLSTRQRTKPSTFCQATSSASEKIVRILPAAGGANQIQARGGAAGKGSNRKYGKAKRADRDRLRRSLREDLTTNGH